MFTDLFVHRTTSMLKATGLRFPGRVVGAGGVYLEYDGRDVPDVATVVADFQEGVQGLVTATMACQETPIQQLIRGHFGSFVFGTGEQFDGFDFIPERPQVTRNSKLQRKSASRPAGRRYDLRLTSKTGSKPWSPMTRAVQQRSAAGSRRHHDRDPGARSYREGKVFLLRSRNSLTVQRSRSILGQTMGTAVPRARQAEPYRRLDSAGDHGSVLEEPEYMKLAGPSGGGKPPEES